MTSTRAIDRRQFLTRALGLSAAGLLVPPFLRGTVAHASQIKGASLSAADPPFGGKILVIVNLQGGNDGLNTVIPRNDPQYAALRPTLAIPQGDTIPLSASTGLHPSLAPWQSWWESGRLAVVQGVGYPEMNLSHFRGAEIWWSASDSEEELSTGWIARFLEAEYPGFPDTLPEAPFGLQQGDSYRLPFQGDRGETGLIIYSPESFYELVLGNYTGNWDDEPPATRGGEELRFVRQLDQETFLYANAIKAAAEAGTTTLDYPSSDLGWQLEAVARLISGQLATPFFLTATGGFDTHTDQAGWHATRLSSVADAVDVFLHDMENQGLLNRVVLLTLSEFGRRPEENGGFGTDHGTSAPHFIFGGAVEGGLIGANPDLSDFDQDGNLHIQNDYRSIYGTILKSHFGADANLVDQVLGGAWPSLGFLPAARPGQGGGTSSSSGGPLANRLYGVAPNPVRGTAGRAEVRFDLARTGPVRLEVFDVGGRRVARIKDHVYAAGSHHADWDLEGLAAGAYVLRMQAEGWERKAKVVVVR